MHTLTLHTTLCLSYCISHHTSHPILHIIYALRSPDILSLIAKVLAFTEAQKEAVGLTSLSAPAAFINSVLTTVVGKPVVAPEVEVGLVTYVIHTLSLLGD